MALFVPVRRYVEENGSGAMLAAERSAVVAPEVNLGKCVTCRLLPSWNKAPQSVFDVTRSPNRCISGPQKRT